MFSFDMSTVVIGAPRCTYDKHSRMQCLARSRKIHPQIVHTCCSHTAEHPIRMPMRKAAHDMFHLIDRVERTPQCAPDEQSRSWRYDVARLDSSQQRFAHRFARRVQTSAFALRCVELPIHFRVTPHIQSSVSSGLIGPTGHAMRSDSGAPAVPAPVYGRYRYPQFAAS